MKTVKECLFLIDSLFCPSLAEMVLPLASVPKWSNSDLLPMLPLGDVLEYLNSCIDKDGEKVCTVCTYHMICMLRLLDYYHITSSCT